QRLAHSVASLDPMSEAQRIVQLVRREIRDLEEVTMLGHVPPANGYGCGTTPESTRAGGDGQDSRPPPPLQNVAPQVLVLDGALEPLADGRGIDHDLASALVREVEEDVLEQRREDGVQPPCTDVLHPRVHVGG